MDIDMSIVESKQYWTNLYWFILWRFTFYFWKNNKGVLSEKKENLRVW